MALLQRTQVGVREFGNTVTVPNNPKAKLMYYLSCVCTVLDLEENVPRRLRNFSTNYNRLSEDETTELLTLCILFSPDILNDKVFFQDNTTLASTNKFLELSSVQSSMILAGDIVIGGRNTRVAKVMTCTRAWLRNNYEQPMAAVLTGQIGGYQNAPTLGLGAPTRRPALMQAPRPNYGSYNHTRNNTPRSSCCCVIL